MINEQIIIKYKSLPIFFLAANSLMLSGYFSRCLRFEIQILLLIWVVICGIFVVYRFNDFIDQSPDLKFNIQGFLKLKSNLFFLLQFFFITLPLSIFYLSNERIILLGVVALIGLLYSINIKIYTYNFRLKKILFLKNILIGFAWGVLILIGAGEYQTPNVIYLFVFSSLQVIIGSIIRDIPDVKKDSQESVKSLPVVFGINSTLNFLHVFNFSTLLISYFLNWEKSFLTLSLLIVFWRAFLLIKIKSNYNLPIWTQTCNLITCIFILLIILVQLSYA